MFEWLFEWLEQKKEELKMANALREAKVTDRPKKIKELKTSWSWYNYGKPGNWNHQWGFNFEWDGRKHSYTHTYMGWTNHSETHRRENCDDPAYCLWHGSL